MSCEACPTAKQPLPPMLCIHGASRPPTRLVAVSLLWRRYWVAVKHGRVDFGVGDVCGQHTVLSYQDPDSPVEVHTYVLCVGGRLIKENMVVGS